MEELKCVNKVSGLWKRRGVGVLVSTCGDLVSSYSERLADSRSGARLCGKSSINGVGDSKPGASACIYEAAASP